MLRRLVLISACLLAAPLTAVGAIAAGLEGLLPHRAVYDLQLDEASDRSGITGMNGRIVYEVTGSACEGFAVRFRFVTQVQTPRKAFENDQRTTSFESPDGNSFNFVNKSYLNGQLEQDQRGKARRRDGQTVVELSKPDELSVELPDAIFTTEHLARIVDAAKAGETVVQAAVYDGSGEADGLMDTTAIIGEARPGVAVLDGESDTLDSDLLGQTAWPVTVSYFEQDDTLGRGEKTPLYSVSFLLYESGLSRKLVMRYPDYSLRGDLQSVEFLPVETCD